MAEAPRPKVTTIRANARRVLALGPRYHSFELTTGVEAEPDPNFKVVENIDLLQRLVISRVDAVCDALEASINAKEGENADV